MEDTLRVSAWTSPSPNLGLNPCFNGRYSQSGLGMIISYALIGLNPCFNGRYSQSDGSFVEGERNVVS